LPGDILTAEGFLVHDVGTLGPAAGTRLGDTLRGFDTPTLKGAWEFPPYLHDGSAATLAEVLAKNPGDKHGRTSQLTAREREQLAAYLLQIDELEGPATAARPGSGLARAGERRAGSLRTRQGIRFFRGSGNAAAAPRYDARGQRLTPGRPALGSSRP
jgi:hypothetical protein